MTPTQYALPVLLATALVHAAGPALAEREPVLKQVRVPHDYYYREMYLPQLTSGPGSLAWSPDGRALVYSMQGSLWRQELDSGMAMQLTAGPGYDYQPDWSPDGSRIVFVRYLDDAMELQLLDLGSGAVTALTGEGAVNVDPRWSPDGSRLAFVSTRDTGRFHVFVGDVVEDTLEARQLFEERRSEIPRYYYSAWDHELSPAWSPDGRQLLYISNPEIPYGTGAIWRRALDRDTDPVLVRKEETTWRAKPDWSPDGKRIAYASYLGRQWHQLWVTTPDGAAEPFPLTYGDFDIASPRWSPDGRRIAYVANESGNTEIRIQDIVGGRTTRLGIRERNYLKPMAELALLIVDRNGRPSAARVSVTGSDGRSYAPADALVHADDGFDRSVADFETHYFHTGGQARLMLPPGPAQVTVWRGLEHGIREVPVDVAADGGNSLEIKLAGLELPPDFGDWLSGDVHVHMNYGGAYRNTPPRLAGQADAEDLDAVFNLIVNKEQRIPDIAYFTPEPDPASTAELLILHGQEFHTSYWGHMGLIGLDSHLLLPDYSAYPGTAAASLHPDNVTVAELAHEQNAAVGYVHPFYAPAPDPQSDAPLTNQFPVSAALGLVDYYEVVGFAHPHASAEVWYGLLNCGMRIAAAGGTDAMANYASLRGPVGVNRTYVRVPSAPADPAARRDAWLDGLKAGATFATNGPLLGLTVDGRHPGSVIDLAGGPRELAIEGFMRSAVPVDHLELVMNGEVVKTVELDRTGTRATFSDEVAVRKSGWLLLRAWNEGAHPLIFDFYPYATTTPVYLSVDSGQPRSPADAEYFIAWIGRLRETASTHPDYNDAAERELILGHLDAAARRFEACR